MALCAYGSQPAPSAPPYVWATWADANAWLGSLSAKFSFLSYLIQPVLHDVGIFCSTEPNQPVYPGDAVVAAAATNPAAFDTIINYLKDSATWAVWSRVCQCKAAPSCSSLLTDSQWNALVSLSGDNNSYHWGASFQASGVSKSVLGVEYKATKAATVGLWFVDATTGTTYHESFAVTAGRQQYYFISPPTAIAGHDCRVEVRTAALAEGIYYLAGTTYVPAPPSGWSATNWYYGQLDNGSDNAIYPGTLGVAPILCNLAPFAPATPPTPTTTLPDVPTGPCASIGDLCGILQPTINQVALLQQRLDLIQRRLLPFAWIAGTPSTGLSGTGSIVVQDILGVVVSLTTVPATWGSTAETPRRLIPAAGSIQASDGTSFTDNWQIHYEHELFLTDTSYATTIRYNLRPGIVATITPLKPEP